VTTPVVSASEVKNRPAEAFDCPLFRAAVTQRWMGDRPLSVDSVEKLDCVSADV